MKSTTNVSFIMTVFIYATVLLVGYWLFSLDIKEPNPQPEKPSTLPLTLNMFQSAKPTIQTIFMPPAVETEVIEKPVVKPIIQPITESKPVSKPKPVAAKPVLKKAAPPAEPVTPKPNVSQTKVIKLKSPKPSKSKVTPAKELVTKPRPTLAAKPNSAATQTTNTEAKVVEPHVNNEVSRQQQANAEQAYLYALRSEILLHAQDTYPRRAKRRRWEGIVTLSFTLLPSGKILGVRIQKSSGRSILDEAATSIFQSKMHNQFQSFPAEITRKEWRITIPVSYHLR